MLSTGLADVMYTRKESDGEGKERRRRRGRKKVHEGRGGCREER